MKFTIDKQPPTKKEIKEEQQKIIQKILKLNLLFFSIITVIIFINIRLAIINHEKFFIAYSVFIFMVLSVMAIYNFIYERRLQKYRSLMDELSDISAPTEHYYSLTFCKKYSELEQYRKKVLQTRNLTRGEFLMMEEWSQKG